MEKGIFVKFNLIFVFVIMLSSFAIAGIESVSVSDFDSEESEIYTQESVDIEVVVTGSNITGGVDVTLYLKSGLTCSSGGTTCTGSTDSFAGGTSEQQTAIITVTGVQTGTYNPPFTSVVGTYGGDDESTSAGDSLTVLEKPTWTLDFGASDESPEVGDEITLTLVIRPSGGSFEGVSADLSLDGLTLVSGSDPRSIGTVSGRTTYQWVASVQESGSASVSVSATNPSESGSSNIESVTITVPGEEDGDNNSPGGGSGGGGGGGAVVNRGYQFWSIVTPGAAQIMRITDSELGIRQITVNVRNQAQNVSINITKYDGKPAEVSVAKSGKVYRYMRIETKNLNENIDNAKIEFSVNESWMLQNGLNRANIGLFRYNEQNRNWEELQTQYKSSSGGMEIFEATTTGFSYFAIGEKVVAASGEDTGTGGSGDTGDSGGVGDKITEIFTNDEGSSKIWLYVVIGILGVGIIVIVLYSKGNNRKSSNR
jgi:PGF-pre-PGF domain-containing protein